MQKTETESPHDSSSSLCSRLKPHLNRNHPNIVDGGADTDTPPLSNPTHARRKSLSFEPGLHDLEAKAEHRYITTNESVVRRYVKFTEIKRLQTDNETLKQQFDELRREFSALRSVLLRAESRRRWRDCVS